MGASKDYHFVGGSMDGQSYPAASELPAGTLIQIPLAGDATKAELYVLAANRLLKFACYALAEPAGGTAAEPESSQTSSAAASEEREVFGQLNHILKALDALDRVWSASSFPRQLNVGNWVMLRREVFESTATAAAAADPPASRPKTSSSASARRGKRKK